MSDPYVGEIRMFAGNYAPYGWLLCDGSLLPISEYDMLFALIGTTYGGDGQSTFALPDLRGRAPLHQGPGYVLGQMAGTERVTLQPDHLPPHTHQLQASRQAASPSQPPTDAMLGVSPSMIYGTGTPTVAMAPQMLGPAGNSQSHLNMPPYLALNFIIAIFGIFPSPA